MTPLVELAELTKRESGWGRSKHKEFFLTRIIRVLLGSSAFGG
jgi:hypothetical protein